MPEPTETYKNFRRALDYLTTERGYEASRLIDLAQTYGYEGFANLAPSKGVESDGEATTAYEVFYPAGNSAGTYSASSRERAVAKMLRDAGYSASVSGSRVVVNDSGATGKYETTPGGSVRVVLSGADTATPGEFETQPVEASGPSGATPATKVLAKYQQLAGLDFNQVKNLGDAIQYVESKNPSFGNVVEDMRASLNGSLANTKHWVALLGAIAYGQNAWRPDQNNRRSKVRRRLREVLDDVTGDQGTTDYLSDLDDAIREVEQKAERYTGGDLAKWMYENISVQPWQLGWGELTDWIEVAGAKGGWF